MTLPIETTEWLREKLEEHRWSGVIESRTVKHRWRLQTGGRVMQAGLTASITPADTFSVTFPVDAESTTYIAAVRNGMFSVLLGHTDGPILKCAVRFESFVIDDMDSSYAAFYRVAKEATERLLGLVPGYQHNIEW